MNQRRTPPGEVVINLTVNVHGLVTQEAIDLLSERLEESIALAMDEARRMQSDVKR